MGTTHQIDVLWLLVCTALVALMQVGFLLLETGAVRAKNGVNVAIKNLADLCLAILLFWGFGYALMFGGAPFFGGGAEADAVAFFLFQAMFCGTAATIVSGAVAERMTFRGYLVLTAILAALIYPVVGGWAWGGAAGGPAGWLERLGFVDFAGATVVHSVGGWAALAAILVIGPRLGRFGKGGAPIEGANLAFSTGGALLLFIGWFGFNGGSLLAFDAQAPAVILATMLGGAGGGAAAATLALTLRRRAEALGLANGVIGGLVSVTAAAHLATPVAAALMGASGGAIAVFGAQALERLKIDDSVGAVPAHLLAGAWGTLAVAAVAPTPFWPALGAQAAGVAAIGAYAFGVTWLALKALDRVVRLRASPSDERIGLNVAEHGARSALHDVLSAMEDQKRSGDFRRRAPVFHGEEAGMIAAQYNRVLDRVEAEIAARERVTDDLAQARDAAEAASRAKSEFLATMSHELRTPMNGVLGLSAVLAGTPLDARQTEIVDALKRSGEDLVAVLGDVLDIAGGADIVRAPVSLAAFAAEIEARFAPAAAAKGLAFSVVCDEPSGRFRLVDVDALLKIARHLIGNAIKFTEQGSVSVRVETSGCDRAALVVRDTGRGVPEAICARLFEPFTQADSSATRRHGGAGLGLAVVAQLTAAMGGEVSVESRDGAGSTFRAAFVCPTVARTEAARPAAR
ncbi:MAG: histidine kinase [Rhodobacteraceae bacterium]|nr:MAG: histidine kinase [Paracoccaceae bacterium]